MQDKLWTLILTSAAMRVGLSVDCLHSGPILRQMVCHWTVLRHMSQRYSFRSSWPREDFESDARRNRWLTLILGAVGGRL